MADWWYKSCETGVGQVMFWITELLRIPRIFGDGKRLKASLTANI